MQSWLEGTNWVGKCAQATGMTASLRIRSSKAESNTWESFTRSELDIWTSSGKELPSHFWNRNIVKSILPGLRRKITGLSKVLFSDESKWKSRCQNLEEVWRGTESMLLEVQCEVSTVSDGLGCRVICWCWSTVFSEVHSQHSHLPGKFRALHGSFCWQALWRSWFHFPAGFQHTLTKVPKAGSMTMVLLCLIDQQTRLTWTPQRIYGVLSRGRWETPDTTTQMTWRPLSKQPGLPLHLSSATGWLPHDTPHWCSNSCKRRPNQVLSA